MSNEKKPVVLLMMNDGELREVVCDTNEGVEIIMVNICSPGSPQENTQNVSIKFPDGEVHELLCNLTRLGVRTPPPGVEDPVIPQFVAACPEGEYSIDRVEVVQVASDGKGNVSPIPPGMIGVQVHSVVQDFAQLYAKEFGELPDPEMLAKYRPNEEE